MIDIPLTIKNDLDYKLSLQQAADAANKGDFDRAEAIYTEAVAYDTKATAHDAEVIGQLQSQITLRKLSAARLSYITGELNLARNYFIPAIRHFEEAARIVPDECKDVKLNYLNAAENARQEQAAYWRKMEMEKAGIEQ